MRDSVHAFIVPTRQYKIATKDIVKFLIEYEAHPENFNFTSFTSKNKRVPFVSTTLPNNKKFNDLLTNYYLNLSKEYPDLLTAAHVSDMLGYSTDTIHKWIHEERFLTIKKGGFLIPKITFMPFVTGQEFVQRQIKSKKHQAQIKEILKMYNE